MLKLVPDTVSVIVICCIGCYYYSTRINLIEQIQIPPFFVVKKNCHNSKHTNVETPHCKLNF